MFSEVFAKRAFSFTYVLFFLHLVEDVEFLVSPALMKVYDVLPISMYGAGEASVFGVTAECASGGL